MTDQRSAAPARVPPKAVAGGALAAIIAAAVIAIAPTTKPAEGNRPTSYLDPALIATECYGHTGPDVRLGTTKAAKQCEAEYRSDMTAHMTAAVKTTPTLVERPSALQAAGDFSFNAGDGWWAKSPMAAAFARRDWRAGCEAFAGFLTLYKAPKVVPGRRCRRNTKGVLYCEAPGLVTRRAAEREVCLAGLWTGSHSPPVLNGAVVTDCVPVPQSSPGCYLQPEQ